MKTSQKISLSVGESYELTLDSLSTSGYSWSCDADTSNVLVTKMSAPSLTDDTKKNVGSSRNEMFEILALKVGWCEIYFHQKRLWEEDLPALNDHFLEILIQ
jgi:predicted secreted protein